MTSETQFDVLIDDDGNIEFVWSDELAALAEQGAATVRRVSHVEPDGKGWSADMSPVGGPILRADNGKPFTTRAAALAAERQYLAEHFGL